MSVCEQTFALPCGKLPRRLLNGNTPLSQWYVCLLSPVLSLLSLYWLGNTTVCILLHAQGHSGARTWRLASWQLAAKATFSSLTYVLATGASHLSCTSHVHPVLVICPLRPECPLTYLNMCMCVCVCVCVCVWVKLLRDGAEKRDRSDRESKKSNYASDGFLKTWKCKDLHIFYMEENMLIVSVAIIYTDACI